MLHLREPLELHSWLHPVGVTTVAVLLSQCAVVATSLLEDEVANTYLTRASSVIPSSSDDNAASASNRQRMG